MADRHIRRDGDDYAQALMALLPQGQAWPRAPEGVLSRTVTGLAKYWGFVDSRAADLLERESDPRFTMEMFSDWERNWGLPDECFFRDDGTIPDRRRILMMKMTLLGSQSREFFAWVADGLGFTAVIREHSPFMVGISRCGNTPDERGNPRWEIGPPQMRFYWSVSVGQVSLSWFRVTRGQVGVDPHVRIGYPEEFICLLEKWKPAHTDIVLDYSHDPAMYDHMAGTP